MTNPTFSPIVIPHEALRRDIIEVQYLLRNHVRTDEPWKLVNFFGWYNKRFMKLVESTLLITEKWLCGTFEA